MHQSHEVYSRATESATHMEDLNGKGRHLAVLSLGLLLVHAAPEAPVGGP